VRRHYRFWVYIMSNIHNTALYVGVSNNILRRVHEHREGKSEHTAKYHLNKLVYAEEFQYIDKAIEREKQLKKYSRQEKINIINITNPKWDDLVESMMTETVQ
jgi:putative endonuclease